jgi:hypothetical protein
VIKFALEKKAQNVYTFLATIFSKKSSGLLKSSPNGAISSKSGHPIPLLNP